MKRPRGKPVCSTWPQDIAAGRKSTRDTSTLEDFTVLAKAVAVLAWFGVVKELQGSGIGSRLLAQALLDCHTAGRTFPFVAVVLDSIDERSKAFYRH